MSILSQDFELVPRETRIQGQTRYLRVFHGIFSQTASCGCRSPSFQRETGERYLICVLCASNSHIVQLTNETVSTFGLDLSRMNCSRALFGLFGRTYRDNNSINNDGLNFNSQKSNYYQTTCSNQSGKTARKVHFCKFESMRFQRQSRKSQEKRIE